MIPPSAEKFYGTTEGADLAARLRSRFGSVGGGYFAAAVVESFYGECRTWDKQGRTMFARITPRFCEWDKRCRDNILQRAYEV
jgi:hypothetical protein